MEKGNLLFYSNISQVMVVSSGISWAALRPITSSILLGEMPVPGRLKVSISRVITLPLGMFPWATRERRALVRAASSVSKLVRA